MIELIKTDCKTNIILRYKKKKQINLVCFYFMVSIPLLGHLCLFSILEKHPEFQNDKTESKLSLFPNNRDLFMLLVRGGAVEKKIHYSVDGPLI